MTNQAAGIGTATRRPPRTVLVPDPVPGRRVAFTVPGEPASKRRHRVTTRNGKIHSYSDPAMTQAQRLVSGCYREASGPGAPGTMGFGVEMHFYVKSRQRRDVDNLTKLVLDGLTGLAWVDDCQVTEIAARIHHGSDNPRSEVTVYPTDDYPDPLGRRCAHCGTTFRLYRSWSKRKFCSTDCGVLFRRKIREQTCENCGVTYSPKETKPQRYCSVACKSAHNTTVKPCMNCGKVVTRPKSQTKAHTFCGTTCFDDYRRGKPKLEIFTDTEATNA